MNHKQFWMTVLAVIVAQVLGGLAAYLLMSKVRKTSGFAGKVG